MNKNTYLLLAILVLVAGSAYVAATKPTHKGLDIQGGMRVVLQAERAQAHGTWDQNKLETTATILRNRVDSLGVSEPVVTTEGIDRVVVELPGIRNKAQALATISSTAKLEFRYVPELDGQWSTVHEKDQYGKTTGYDTINDGTGKPILPAELQDKVFNQPPILAGDELLPNSSAELTPRGYVVHFEFKGDKKQIFEDFTRSHVGKRLAVFLDQKLISAPTINEVIPGTGIIEGQFDAEQAKGLANQLNAGALPVPLDLMEQNSVEATLGNAAVKQTLTAGIIGLSLVLVFMAGYYLLPGVLADIALLMYALFTFAIFKLVPVTLTVPGIAGFILSIGMAVDANILIFERMKEERRAGRTLRAAVEVGFTRAFSAIRDSNICTLITCGVLYWFGTGQVKGFALTLAIGVAVSMFTAITCTRNFLVLITRTGFGENDKLYGLKVGYHPKLHMTKRIPLWFGISIGIIVPGLIFMGLGGVKRSIEFTGGTEFVVQYTASPSVAGITSALSSVGFPDARVLLAQGDIAYVTVRSHATGSALSVTDQARATTALQQTSGKVTAFNAVSGTISGEIILNAVKSVLLASLLIVGFLAIQFSIPNFMEGLKFGTCAVIALLHDILVLLGSFAILGYFLNWEVDSLFVTAMLTVIGFSVHDTIIIFDRIRENLHNKGRGESFADVADRSVEQTLARSINTSGTVVLTLACLLLFGGPVVRLFAAALLIGVVSGTYSSIFNASPLLVLWKRAVERSPAVAAAGVGAARTAARPGTGLGARATAPAYIPKLSQAPTTTAREPVESAESGPPSDITEAAEARLREARNAAARKRKRRM